MRPGARPTILSRPANVIIAAGEMGFTGRAPQSHRVTEKT
jgi:hypothetical protein